MENFQKCQKTNILAVCDKEQQFMNLSEKKNNISRSKHQTINILAVCHKGQ